MCVTTLTLNTIPNFSVFHSIMNNSYRDNLVSVLDGDTLSRWREAGPRDVGKWHQQCN
jgi:hypothetical protein